MTEALQSQPEVATPPPCEPFDEARVISRITGASWPRWPPRRGLASRLWAPFLLAYWPEQTVTPKSRYKAIIDDLQMIGYLQYARRHARSRRGARCRNAHQPDHAPDALFAAPARAHDLLAALARQFTGLVGYRLAAYDELPRTGLPELFRNNDDCREFVAALRRKLFRMKATSGGRSAPPLRNLTIELRVADSCTRLDDAPAVAALFQGFVRALDRDRALNAGFDRVGRAITRRTSGMLSATAFAPLSSSRSRDRPSRSCNGWIRSSDL